MKRPREREGEGADICSAIGVGGHDKEYLIDGQRLGVRVRVRPPQVS